MSYFIFYIYIIVFYITTNMGLGPQILAVGEEVNIYFITESGNKNMSRLNKYGVWCLVPMAPNPNIIIN